ncbi:MAG TPA: sugar phosphate nucleotidyltransferase [Verrucomicrobiaceae bacterium]|jgi:mannose-1-phosphate guanylyltransferase/mannose-1-phosphate guanylyltransferase/phosphomannomutase
MDKAFVLGAGLGFRLRPLTDRLPKPLVPLFHRPLITYAFDHLIQAGVREFIVNTHHLSEKYGAAFPDSCYRDASLIFRHEPVLLETAGGIANIADLVRDAPFIVYNGDILTDLPLAPLLETHRRDGNLVTLVLRSSGPARHVAFDAARGLVTDIRNKLQSGDRGTHQFTGIYAVHPDFLQHLTPGKIESVIPVFLKLISLGARTGGVVIDDGMWWDLGDRENYLEAHRCLQEMGERFPAYATGTANPAPGRERISHGASVHPTARLHGCTVVGKDCRVGADAVLEDCILWSGASVAPGAHLKRCIVLGGSTAQGCISGADL